MKMLTNEQHPAIPAHSRRRFIQGTVKAAFGASLLSSAVVSCGNNGEDKNEKEVSPPEDLMQEHGVLNRILLIYDDIRLHLEKEEDFSGKNVS